MKTLKSHFRFSPFSGAGAFNPRALLFCASLVAFVGVGYAMAQDAVGPDPLQQHELALPSAQAEVDAVAAENAAPEPSAELEDPQSAAPELQPLQGESAAPPEASQVFLSNEDAAAGTAAAAKSDDSFDFLPSLPEANEGFQGEEFKFEQTPEELKEELRREAFDAALQGVLPLRPGEIKELLSRYDQTQEAIDKPVYSAPKPEVVVQTLSLDPGVKPTTIKVAYGYVTTLNVVDSTGAPWPIEDVTWAGNFEIVEFSGDNGAAHFIRIAPQSEFAFGNISIHLLGLQTPLIVSLETSREIVHYRFDAIIPEPGPLARAPLMETGLATAAGNVDMTGILEGMIPSGAARLGVSGVDGRTTAYRFNGLTYLRTPLTLLSPAWVSSTSSADGMRVYAMAHAPVLLVSDKGKMVRVRLSDREDILNEQ